MNANSNQTASSVPDNFQQRAPGGNRAVIEAGCSALDGSVDPTLAVVLETIGSTYVNTGAIALFADTAQTGWLSGGCLEPEIARRAAEAASDGYIKWMEVDTRDDESLFGGSAVGCRGRLRLALLPLRAMPGWSSLAASWLARRGPMELSLTADGNLRCGVDDESVSWQLASSPLGWKPDSADNVYWRMEIAAPPSVLLFGAGPEAPVLLPLLRSMGWMTSVVERRDRWATVSKLADRSRSDSPAQALAGAESERPFAALVMHHNFELDLEALLALADNPPPFIGLLGPRRRRDDLFKLLPESARESLAPNLHSPVGIDLGGRGPEAIALSIAAQLQSTLYGRSA